MGDVKAFLEHCYLHAIITGVFINQEGKQNPFAGITGIGENHERNGKRSVWTTGEIISPIFIDNGFCACRGHIEGIVTDQGIMNVLETVYDFPAREGDSNEYVLKVEDFNALPLVFKGPVITRTNRDNFKPRKVGDATMTLNPFWTSQQGGASRSFSKAWGWRDVHVSGSYLPECWNDFLARIEKRGYNHMYGAVTQL